MIYLLGDCVNGGFDLITVSADDNGFSGIRNTEIKNVNIENDIHHTKSFLRLNITVIDIKTPISISTTSFAITGTEGEIVILGGNITLSKGSFTDLSLVKISVKVRGGVSVGILSINTENNYKSVDGIKSVKINNENNGINNNFNNNFYHEIDQYGNLILFGTFLNVKNNLKNLEFNSAKRFSYSSPFSFSFSFSMNSK